MRRRESAALLVAPLLVVLLAAASEATTTAQLTADLLAEPKYAIHFAKAPLWDADVTDDLLDDPLVMDVVAPTGEYYVCRLPKVAPTTDAGRQPKADALTRPTAAMLLKPLQGTCTYRVQGWWTYEICFGKHIRQYHEEKDQPKPTMEFFLGLHTAQSELDESGLAPSHEVAFASANYTGGTECDLTGTPRWTDVRFFCNRQTTTHISAVKETSTCKYQATVVTPLLCTHHVFDNGEPAPLPITCQLVMSEEEMAAQAREEEQAVAAAQALLQAAADAIHHAGGSKAGQEAPSHVAGAPAEGGKDEEEADKEADKDQENDFAASVVEVMDNLEVALKKIAANELDELLSRLSEEDRVRGRHLLASVLGSRRPAGMAAAQEEDGDDEKEEQETDDGQAKPTRQAAANRAGPRHEL